MTWVREVVQPAQVAPPPAKAAIGETARDGIPDAKQLKGSGKDQRKKV